MKDYLRRRVLRVYCAKCDKLRIVSGDMTKKEADKILKRYVCTDHEKGRNSALRVRGV